MRLGVADRNRTDVTGPTTQGSPIELRPPPSARHTGLDGRNRTDAGTCRLICNQAPSTTWLHRESWRPVPDSNRRPPAGQASTLATESTRQCKRFRSRVPEPPNRCGRFASHGVSACATSGCWRRARELNPHTRNEAPESLPIGRTRHEDFHFGCALARALPSEAASRCTRPGEPPRTSRAAYTWRFCGVGVRGHTRSERTNEKARILLRDPGLWNSECGRTRRQTRLPPGSGRSSDSRCAGACPIGRSAPYSEKAHASAQPTRAGALRWAFRLFTMGVLVRFRSRRGGPRLLQMIVAFSSDGTQCK